jgi:alpha-acetolactate decarboxylase
MLNMDQIDDIKKAAQSSMSVSAIAATRNIDRKTIRKYILFTGDTNEGHFPLERTTTITANEQDIEDLLLSQSAFTAVKHKLTAKRIHTMLLEGTLCDKPPINVSIRTVERLVKKVRTRIR